MKEFGNANEFYRLRIISMDFNGVEKFDWNEDILFKEPKRKEIKTKTSYILQIIKVNVSDPIQENIFHNEEDAKHALENISDDLETMTKNEFDVKYISC